MTITWTILELRKKNNELVTNRLNMWKSKQLSNNNNSKLTNKKEIIDKKC